MKAAHACHVSCFAAALTWLVLAAGCSEHKVVIGEQCPEPYNKRATLAMPDAAPAEIYGTSCAPCDGSGERFDTRGCPIFVTFESCGGPICLWNVPVQRLTDAGDDGGTDGGVEDGGAPDGGADAGDASAR